MPCISARAFRHWYRMAHHPSSIEPGRFLYYSLAVLHRLKRLFKLKRCAQDKMFRGYSMTTFNQILYTTLWSTLLSLFGLLSSGQLWGALSFIVRHPDVRTRFPLSLQLSCDWFAAWCAGAADATGGMPGWWL